MARPEETAASIVWPESTKDDKPLYANAIMVNHTPWDFAIHFTHVIIPARAPVGSSGTVEIEGKSVASISFPVTLVRGFIEALQTNLDRYEEKFGKIEIPKGVKKENGNGSA